MVVVKEKPLLNLINSNSVTSLFSSSVSVLFVLCLLNLSVSSCTRTSFTTTYIVLYRYCACTALHITKLYHCRLLAFKTKSLSKENIYSYILSCTHTEAMIPSHMYYAPFFPATCLVLGSFQSSVHFHSNEHERSVQQRASPYPHVNRECLQNTH